MIETVRVDQWLHATLTADGTLAALVADRVYADLAPQTARWPAVVFNEQAPVDTLGIDGARILTSVLFQVKVITDEPSWQGLGRQAADRVDDLLHGASGTAGGVAVGTCHREQIFRFVEVTEGKQYRHLGGLYRINVY